MNLVLVKNNLKKKEDHMATEYNELLLRPMAIEEPPKNYNFPIQED